MPPSPFSWRAAWCLVLVGCGGSVVIGPPGVDGGNPDSGSVETPDGGGPSDSGTHASNVTGSVSLVVNLLPDGGNVGASASASFVWGTPGQVPCTADAGSCCRLGALDGGAANLPAASAGNITVFDLTSGVPLAGLSSPYGTVDVGAPAPGDQVLVSAPGADLGPFAATLDYPGALVGLTPALADGGLHIVPLASDLVLTWTPGAGAAWFVLSLEVEAPDAGNAPRGSLQCRTLDSAGSMVVSRALFFGWTAGNLGSGTVEREAVQVADGGNGTVRASTASRSAIHVQFQ